MAFYLKIHYTKFVLFVTLITTPSLSFIEILGEGIKHDASRISSM